MLTALLFLCPTHFPTVTSQKRLAEIKVAATRGQGKVWGSRASPTLSGGLSHSHKAAGPECLHTTLFFPLQKCYSSHSGPSSFPLHQWLQSMIRQHNPCFLDSLAPAGMSSMLTMVAACFQDRPMGQFGYPKYGECCSNTAHKDTTGRGFWKSIYQLLTTENIKAFLHIVKIPRPSVLVTWAALSELSSCLLPPPLHRPGLAGGPS